MKKIILAAALLVHLNAISQDTSIQTAPVHPFSFSGYVEAYYSYDFNTPSNNTKPSYIYNYNRHNEFNLNLGYLQAAYNTERVRTRLAVAVGSYMNANYAAEPATIKNIFEANAGYKISSKKNLWFDIGIMPSHIGFESAIGKDNWNLTRSLVAENSPYFESGAKLSYGTDNGKLTISALVLNGWQRITRVDGNSLISFGTQINYKPNDKITLNYSTFFGTDTPDSARLYRTYHDFYGIFQLSPLLGITAGFDIGTQQSSPTGDGTNIWYSPVAILRLTPSNKWAFAFRGQYYNDEYGVIISSSNPNWFITSGWSANIDYMPAKNVSIRLEGLYFTSKYPVFTKDEIAKDNNAVITFSTAVSF